MRTLVILNPEADLGRALRHKEAIEQAGQELEHFDLLVTDSAAHARHSARAAAHGHYEVVIAAGGDGTVHEVVNGIMEDGKARAHLGVIPIGTGNDFAFGLGIPLEPVAAVRHLCSSEPRLVDLAQLVDDQGHREMVANNLGVGFDANVVIRTEAITRLHGFPKYLWGVLKTLALDFHPLRFKMRFDDEEVARELLFVSLGLGTRHGGGFMLTPDALQDDGLIDSCAVAMLSRARALWLLNSAVKGTHIHVPEVTMRQSSRIEIASEEPLPIHVDGEVFARPDGDVRAITVTSLPAALAILA